MTRDVLLLIIGASLSIPIGIATGLAVEPIRRRFEGREQARAAVLSAKIREEYADVMFYRLYPHIFTQYLLRVTLQLSLVGAVVGLIAGLGFAIGQFCDFARSAYIHLPGFGRLSAFVPQVLYVVAQSVTVFSSLLILSYCRPALLLWRRVRNFDDFVKIVPMDVRDLPAERLAAQREEGTVPTA